MPSGTVGNVMTVIDHQPTVWGRIPWKWFAHPMQSPRPPCALELGKMVAQSVKIVLWQVAG